MKKQELLVVEDTFQITGRGVVISPDFSVPDRWTEHNEVVTIQFPDGTEHSASAYFGRAHFQIPDPVVSVDRRWRILVTFRDLSKDQIPLGSRIYASRDICELLGPPLSNQAMQTEHP